MREIEEMKRLRDGTALPRDALNWLYRDLTMLWPPRPDAADVMEIETILDAEGLEK